MISRLRKLPVSLLVVLFIVLMCATYYVYLRSETRVRIANRCFNFTDNLESCYESHYQTLAEHEGTEAALRIMRERATWDRRLTPYCHQPMHAIGRVAFHEHATLADAFAGADYTCWGGYLHGVVEAAMRAEHIRNISDEKLRKFCDEIRDNSDSIYALFSCVHGLGHALMFLENNNLPIALNRCNILLDPWEVRQCKNGALMENVQSDTKDHKSAFLPKNDLRFPCNILPGDDAEICYLVHGRIILDRHGWDFSASFDFCDGLSSEMHRLTCAEGLGAVASNHASHDPKKISRTCSKASASLRDPCLFGAISDLEGVVGDSHVGLELCEHEPTEKRSSCLALLKRAQSRFPGANSGATNVATSEN